MFTTVQQILIKMLQCQVIISNRSRHAANKFRQQQSSYSRKYLRQMALGFNPCVTVMAKKISLDSCWNYQRDVNLKFTKHGFWWRFRIGSD